MGMNSDANPLALDLDHILEHTRPLWEQLRGERLFISGGTGFFGCWLLESLVWANDRLKLACRASVLTRSPDAFRAKAPHLANHSAVTLLPGDVRTFDFPAGTFSHVIHAATESSARLNAENPLRMLDTILDGTRRMLDFGGHCGAKRFLFTSSGAVYGPQPPELAHIPEDYGGAPDPLDSGSAYGLGKRLAEHLCLLSGQAANFEVQIARCFAFVGPYLPLDVHFAVGNFIRDALQGGPIIVKGDGTPRRSYLYAADLAIWLWTILFTGQSMQAYNVGGEESLSIADVAGAVAGCFGPDLRVEIRGTPGADWKLAQYVPSTAKAQTHLGLRQWISLRESISRTVAFHRGRE